MIRLSEVVNSDFVVCWLYVDFLKLFVIGLNESDCDFILIEEKEMERDKSCFIVKFIVFINVFLFLICFFMDNFVFLVSIVGKCFCYCFCKYLKW